MYRSPENSVFLFRRWDIMKCLNASMLETAVFELVQQFDHATEFGNVATSQYSQRQRWSATADRIKTIISDKVNYRGTQS